MSQSELNRPELNRRGFHRLTMAAMGGMVTGSLLGCPKNSDNSPADATAPAGSDSASSGEEVSLLLQDPHVCRGLNTCEGKGASKDNACAGQGTCSAVAHHSCGGQNECKGQGGCGAKPGENSCKGHGLCAVPLVHVWDKARANFEAAMTAAGKTFGEAPAAAPAAE